MIKGTLNIAKELGITLKNLKTFPGHDGMQGFDADICVNGKKVLHVYDSAHGGCFEFRPVDTDYRKAREVEAELEEKIAKYPKYPCDLGGGTRMMQDSLECVVGALVSDMEMQKDIKKDEKKGIMVETKFGYEIIKYKAGTLPKLIEKYSEIAVSLMVQAEVKKLIKQGETILNQRYLESIGVKF